MSANKYLEYGIDELKSIISELQAQSPINTNELIAARNALSEKMFDSGTEPQEEQVQKYEFINQFDFDSYAGTGSDILNNLVQMLLNKVRSQSTLQVAEMDVKLREKDESISGYEAQISNLSYQNKSLQETVSELSDYKLNNEDYKSRFEAATAKLDEQEHEIERLKRRESDLQQQLANAPAPTARQPIDITADTDINALIAQANDLKNKRAAEEEANWKASRIKVTNIRWEDSIRQINYLAELVEGPEAGNTITFNRLEKGKYLEVTADEASRFRAESMAASQEVTVESVPLVTTEITNVEQFREEENTVRQLEGLDTPLANEVVQQTIEERVEQVEREQAMMHIWLQSVDAALKNAGIQVPEVA